MRGRCGLFLAFVVALAASAPVPNEKVLKELLALKGKLWTLDKELSKYDIPVESSSQTGPDESVAAPVKRGQTDEQQILDKYHDLGALLERYPSRKPAVMESIMNPKPSDPRDVVQPPSEPSKRGEDAEQEVLDKNPMLASLLAKYPSMRQRVMKAVLRPLPADPKDTQGPSKRGHEDEQDILAQNPQLASLLDKYPSTRQRVMEAILNPMATDTRDRIISVPEPDEGQFGEFAQDDNKAVKEGEEQWENKPALDTELGVQVDADKRCEDGNCDKDVSTQSKQGLIAKIRAYQRRLAAKRNPEKELESLLTLKAK